MVNENTTESDLGALERFVVENDDLLELEERIGKFNIFDALGVARAEIRHSNFLAWLLDPAESHGQGSLFLKAILMDLLKQAPPDLRPLSPVELDGEELRGVEVRREWKKIDLIITCKEPPFVIAIENKIDSGEGEGQLSRYRRTVAEHFAELKPMFVFLTTDGTEPSDEDWVPYSYADIHRVLERVRRSGHGAIGDDVEAFLEHYLRLIGSRFMDDPKIDELCQRIYKNHRQAIELIAQRCSGYSLLTEAIEEVINRRSDRWSVVGRTGAYVYFQPVEWLKILPRIGRSRGYEPHSWLVLSFQCMSDRLRYVPGAGATTDPDLRRRIVEALTRPENEWGFRVRKGKFGDEWTQLGARVLLKWRENDPDVDAVVSAVTKELDYLQDRFARVPDALRPIIEEWKKSQAR